MKYIGWILFFVSICIGSYGYFFILKPLENGYENQKKEISILLNKHQTRSIDTVYIKDTLSHFDSSKTNNIIATLQSDEVFKPLPEIKLTEIGKHKIDNLIKNIPNGKNIMIIVHTDKTPVGKSLRKRFPTNWELSAVRASLIARYMSKSIEVKRLYPVGAAASKPISNNNTQNRRIEFIIFNNE